MFMIYSKYKVAYTIVIFIFFFFNDTATTEIYTLSLHDALPISPVPVPGAVQPALHHARHDHAAAVRDADPVRLRELHRAVADRRAGRVVPAAERPRVLAVLLRRLARAGRLPDPGRRRGLRLVRVPAVV